MDVVVIDFIFDIGSGSASQAGPKLVVIPLSEHPEC